MHWAHLEASARGGLIAACPAWKRGEEKTEPKNEITQCVCVCVCYVCVEEALKEVSLDKFLARNTSEDNVSFSEIMAEAEKKQRLKHAWLYEKVDEQLEVSIVVWCCLKFKVASNMAEFMGNLKII